MVVVANNAGVGKRCEFLLWDFLLSRHGICILWTPNSKRKLLLPLEVCWFQGCLLLKQNTSMLLEILCVLKNNVTVGKITVYPDALIHSLHWCILCVSFLMMSDTYSTMSTLTFTCVYGGMCWYYALLSMWLDSAKNIHSCEIGFRECVKCNTNKVYNIL
jgi:hypothetical protein